MHQKQAQRKRAIYAVVSTLLIGSSAYGIARGQIGSAAAPTPAMKSGAAAGSTDKAVAQAQREIQKMLRLRDTAIEKKDAEGSIRCYADDYHYQSDTGPQTKSDLRKSAVEVMRISQSIHSQTLVEDLQLSDGGKTATLIERSHVVLVTHASKDEKAHTMKLDSVARGVWTKTGDGAIWLKHTQTSLSRTGSMDGKSMPMPTPAPVAPATANPAPADSAAVSSKGPAGPR